MKDIFSKYKKIIFKTENEDNSDLEDDMEISLPKKNTKNKKRIENLVTFIVILVVTVIMINKILKEDSNNSNHEPSDRYKKLVNVDTKDESIAVANIDVQTNLKGELEKVLNKMQGVRKSRSPCYIFSN